MLSFYGMVLKDLTDKKHLLSVFPNQNVDSFRKRIIQILKDKGYAIQIKKGQLHVKKGSSVKFPDSITAPAVNLYLKQEVNKVEVYWAESITTQTMIFFFIRPVITESSSDFAKKEILPILQQHFGD